MKALVTGGAGLIGSHLVDLLLAEGWDVTVVDNLHPAVHPPRQPRPEWSHNAWPSWSREQAAKLLRCDVRDTADVLLAMKHVDVVFHQAAFGGFAPTVREYSDVNVGGTATVMEAAQRAGVSKVVVASSQAVYGVGVVECPDGYTVARRDPKRLAAGEWEPVCGECGRVTTTPPLVEHQSLLPRSPYALSKFHEEKLALELGARWELPVVALRYSLTYGPRQSLHNPYTGICSIFSMAILNGDPPVIYEDGLQTRDFVYVEDVAAANLLVATEPRADGCFFNVGTGVATTVLGFATTLQRAIAARRGDPPPDGLEYKAGAFRPDDVRHVVSDASRLRELGWLPRVGVDDGVARYVDWLLSQPTPPNSFEAAELKLIREGIVVDPTAGRQK